MKEAPASGLRPSACYRLLTSLVVPRPIAWVSTRDADGHTNLAPFSYFNGVGSDPPMISISFVDKKDGSEKDTLRIARATGVFCVNLVEEHLLQQMNASSAELPATHSEIDALHIDTTPCVAIDGVRVAGARAHLECKLVDVHRYGRAVGVNLVVAEVVHFAVDDAIIVDGDADGAVDPRAIAPVSRLGASWYGLLGERVWLERPKA